MTPLLLVLGSTTYDLRLRPTAGPIVLNAVENRTEGKVHTSLGTRFVLSVGRDLGASLTIGPFNSQGRVFGRPKVRNLPLTPQGTLRDDPLSRPPFLLSTPLPGHPVRLGEAWTGVFVGPTPMPAGVKASFRALGPARVAGVPCVRVAIGIDSELGGAKITGKGEETVRLADGLVQSGALDVLLVYRRPNPVSHKMEESARVNVKATISR